MRIFSLLLTSLLFTSTAGAGNGVNNGGDYIRSKFIEFGLEVVDYLEKNDDGKKISLEQNLDTQKLKATLDINRIQVVSGPLTDNSGSRVDAHGVKNLIRLDENKWMQLVTSENDIYYLIFHEMLRSAEVNDDNYVVSFKLNPFKKLRTEERRPRLPTSDVTKEVTIADKWAGHANRLDFLTSDDEGRLYTAGTLQSENGKKVSHWVKLSDDNGVTWKVVGNFDEEGLQAYTGAHLFTTGRHSNDDIYSIGNVRTGPSSFKTVLRISTDHGSSWTKMTGPNGLTIQFGTAGQNIYALVLPEVDCGKTCRFVVYKKELDSNRDWSVVGNPISLATSSWEQISNTRMYVSGWKIFISYFHHRRSDSYVIPALATLDPAYGDLQINTLVKDELSGNPCPMTGDEYNKIYMACRRVTPGINRTEWAVRKLDGINLQGEIVDAYAHPSKKMSANATPEQIALSSTGKIAAAGYIVGGGYNNYILVARTSVDKGNTWMTQSLDYFKDYMKNDPAKYLGSLTVKGIGFDKNGAMVVGFSADGQPKDGSYFLHHLVARFN